METAARELLHFIEKSPSSYHAVAQIAGILEEKGYKKLCEQERWELKTGGSYYVTRNDSSLIAFRIHQTENGGFHIIASHSDSPTFKIKENPEITTEGGTRLNVEKYGGMICSTWLDRPLSIAGRVMVKEGDGMGTRLIKVDRDLVLIPNLAIHMNRKINEGYEFNGQKDMLPIFALDAQPGDLRKLIAEEAHVDPEDILGTDLFLYNRVPGSIWGKDGEFLSSGRLDDLQCGYFSLRGFLKGTESSSVPVYCILDNEEVGSSTKQGAASTFLKDTLKRINRRLGGDEEDYMRRLAKSFMISADNAHAVHPSYPEKADPTNRPRLNGGVVIKYNANQKYTTDAVSEGVFRHICREAGVPVQSFFNRSDMAGGSTLGNIANNQTPMNTVDIGLPQLAMHSAYETAGVKDGVYLEKAAQVFYSRGGFLHG